MAQLNWAFGKRYGSHRPQTDLCISDKRDRPVGNANWFVFHIICSYTYLSFLTGHATVSYLVWTLAPLCIALLSFLVLWRSLRHLPYGRYSNHERLRKVNLARSIELEVSERVAKKYERK